MAWTFPVRPSTNGRYLVQPNQGGPFPFFLDSSWMIAVNLDSADWQTYLTDRKKKLFTALLLQPIEHKFTDKKPPLNFVNELPFTQRIDGNTYTGSPNGTTSQSGNENQFAADPYANINTESPDFTFINTTFWNRITSFLDLASANQFLVAMFAAYVGFAGGQEGWMGEMVVNDAVTGAGGFTGQPWADATKTKMWNFGAWFGNFFSGRDNLVMIHGGDYGNPGGLGGEFTVAQKAAVNNVLAGILSIPGQSYLQTAHWSRSSIAADVTLPAGSFDLQSAYSDVSGANEPRAAYASSPAKPSFVVENIYDLNVDNTSPYRRFLWWGATSSTGAVTYGNDRQVWPLWGFPSNWQTSLESQCEQDAARLNAFVLSLSWWTLVPSGLGGMRTIVTANGHNPTDQTYVSASADPAGSLCVLYVPPAWNDGSLNVDMGVMGGTTLARWFDPTNATYRQAGTFAAGGTRTFVPPGANSAGDTDWALVLTRSNAKSTFNFGGF